MGGEPAPMETTGLKGSALGATKETMFGGKRRKRGGKSKSRGTRRRMHGGAKPDEEMLGGKSRRRKGRKGRKSRKSRSRK